LRHVLGGASRNSIGDNMQYLGTTDYCIIGGYFLALVCLGLYLSRRASKSLDEYFLGGRSLPWWALGISGMGWSVDVTGTMLIVSLLYLLGPRGLFIEFRGFGQANGTGARAV